MSEEKLDRAPLCGYENAFNAKPQRSKGAKDFLRKAGLHRHQYECREACRLIGENGVNVGVSPIDFGVFKVGYAAGVMTTDQRLYGFVSVGTSQSAPPKIRGHSVLN